MDDEQYKERVDQLSESIEGLREEFEMQTTDRLVIAGKIMEKARDLLEQLNVPVIMCAADFIPIEGTNEAEVKLVQISTVSTHSVLNIMLPAIEINARANIFDNAMKRGDQLPE